MGDKTRSELLESRILIALADDEEFLEEIYSDVSFSITELGPPDDLRLAFVQLKSHYRLEEIVSALVDLEQHGIVTHRRIEGFPDSAGITANMYRLTDLGKTRCDEVVMRGVSQLFS